MHLINGFFGFISALLVIEPACFAQKQNTGVTITDMPTSEPIQLERFAMAASVPPCSRAAQQFRLRQLTITGNVRTKEVVILHMIPLEPGDIFNQARWETGIAEINRSGLFKPITDTDIILKTDPVNGIVDVELHLTEVDHRRVDFSGGGGTTGGTSFAFDYADSNLTGRGDRLRSRLIIGTREQSAAGQYSLSLISQRQPIIDLASFFERSTIVDARLLNGTRDPLYIQNSAGGTAGASFAVDRTRYAIAAPTRAGFSYSFTSTSVSDLFSTPVLGTASPSERIRTGSLNLFLLHDTLDREFDPQAGSRLSLGVDLAARAFGGSLDNVRPYVDYRKFFDIGGPAIESLGERSSLGFRFRAAHIAPFGKSFQAETLSVIGGVPLFRRFFLGGETEVRGYDFNSMAPLARVQRFTQSTTGELTLASSDVRPVGGDSEVIFNAEYRVPIVWRISAAAFFDIGASLNARRLDTERFVMQVPNQQLGTIDVITVLSRPAEPEFQLPNYRYSTGFELRFPVPVLNIPLRLIFAANPNAQTTTPAGALVAPEKRFAFRVGFSRTL